MQTKTGSDPLTPDEEATPGGIVTTLHKVDLPILRALLPLPLPPISRAVLDIPLGNMTQLKSLLPYGTSYADLLDHVQSLALLPPHTVLGSTFQKRKVADLLQPYEDNFSLLYSSTWLTVLPILEKYDYWKSSNHLNYLKR
jgi:hypothetical protein